ncbi:MAG: Ig-like domain-containing protein [Flavobacteriales bacterium]
MRSVLPLIALLALFLQRCAQVHPPSGGPKDRTAPKVVRAVPANGTVNFEGKGFVLHFDEYIRTARIRQELIVSPPLKETPNVSVDGKALHVEWNAPLEPGRTYSFRFGNSIRDINEGNAAKGLVYAISTGEHLDSLHFQGRIVDARTMEGVEGVLAMLYRDQADSVPRTQRPYYFARSDEKGHFDIPYLAKGRYKFFALKDQNRNQRYDLPDEPIGFLKDPVRPYKADSSGGSLIRLFVESREDQFIEERKIEPGRAFFKLKLGTEKLRLLPLGDTLMPWDHLKRHPKGSDTAVYWFPDPEMPDSTRFRLVADGMVLDTLLVRNGSELWANEDGLSLEMAFKPPLELNEKAALKAAHPLQALDTSSIIGVSDSDTVALKPGIGGPVRRHLFLGNEGAYLENGLELELLPGAVTDTFGRTNSDTLRFSFGVRKKEYYAELGLFLGSKEKQKGILRLKDVQGNTVRKRIDSTGKWLEFPYLSPSGYRIELILDRIPNGKWDPGNYPERQPEPVLYYPDTIKARSNWEQKIEWKGIGE